MKHQEILTEVNADEFVFGSSSANTGHTTKDAKAQSLNLDGPKYPIALAFLPAKEVV